MKFLSVTPDPIVSPSPPLQLLQLFSSSYPETWGQHHTPSKCVPEYVLLRTAVRTAKEFYLHYEGDNITATSGHQIALKLYKSVLGLWVQIPCVDNIGSCTYTAAALCGILPSKCPSWSQQYNFPCHCPFNAGTYSIPAPGVEILIPNPGIGWLTDVPLPLTRHPELTLRQGDFKAEVSLTNAAGKLLICEEVIVALTT